MPEMSYGSSGHALPGRVSEAVEQSITPRRLRRPGRRAPGQGQCELFSLLPLSRFSPALALEVGVTGDGWGFYPEGNVDFVHQDLDPGAHLINPFGFCGGGGCVQVVKFTEEIVEIGQVHLLLVGRLRAPHLADVLKLVTNVGERHQRLSYAWRQEPHPSQWWR